METYEELELIKNTLKLRLYFYAFLSRVFSKEVDEHFLKDIKDFLSLLKNLCKHFLNEDLTDGTTELETFINNINIVDRDKLISLLTDLASEYASLFLSVGPEPVYLIESVYMTPDQTTHGPPYFEVLYAYRALGFEKVKEFKEPEDHIAAEFAFMAYLCDFTLKSIDEGRIDYAIGYMRNQKEFFQEHLLKWVPMLSDRLRQVSKHGFYHAIACLVSGFIDIEKESIPLLIELLEQITSRF